MAKHGPDPAALFPLPGYPHAVFLKNLIDLPNVEIGEYTYYDDREGPERFLRNIRYHYGFSGDRLVIGRFCALAKDVSFIMNDANHALSGLSTYPFAIFRQGWEETLPIDDYPLPRKGDTVIGNDVWIGSGATILPGVRIGDGAVVGAEAVVGTEVPPYAVVAGNPARIVRQRFDESTAARMQAIAWWNWPAERITRAIPALVRGDLKTLEELAAES